MRQMKRNRRGNDELEFVLLGKMYVLLEYLCALSVGLRYSKRLNCTKSMLTFES